MAAMMWECCDESLTDMPAYPAKNLGQRNSNPPWRLKMWYEELEEKN
jgi:hypothetical protein